MTHFSTTAALLNSIHLGIVFYLLIGRVWVHLRWDSVISWKRFARLSRRWRFSLELRVSRGFTGHFLDRFYILPDRFAVGDWLDLFEVCRNVIVLTRTAQLNFVRSERIAQPDWIKINYDSHRMTHTWRSEWLGPLSELFSIKVFFHCGNWCFVRVVLTALNDSFWWKIVDCEISIVSCG